MNSDIPSTSVERKVEEIFKEIETYIKSEDFDRALELIDENRTYLQQNADMHHQVLLNKHYAISLYRKIKDTYSKDKDTDAFVELFEKHRSYLEVHVGINEYKRLLDIYDRIQKKKIQGKLKIIIPVTVVLIGVLVSLFVNFESISLPNFSMPSFFQRNNGESSIAEESSNDEAADAPSYSDEEIDELPSDEQIVDENVHNENEPNYILPSHSKELTLSDIEGMSSQDIRLAINEMYARHGYYFGSGANQRYFDQQEWYVPDESLRDASDVVNNFSDLENRNLAFLASQERRLRNQ